LAVFSVGGLLAASGRLLRGKSLTTGGQLVSLNGESGVFMHHQAGPRSNTCRHIASAVDAQGNLRRVYISAKETFGGCIAISAKAISGGCIAISVKATFGECTFPSLP
jgi:hypothetical protein